MLYGTLTVLALVFLGAWIALSRLHPAWWARRWVRVALWGLLGIAVTGTMLRTLARSGWVGEGGAHHAGLAITGVALASPAMVTLLALFLSLPLAAGMRKIAARLAVGRGEVVPPQASQPVDEPAPRVAAPEPSPILIRRRPLVELATLSIPAAFVGAGAIGVGGALVATRIVPRTMRFAGLPPDLVGIRVLQLTDLHVGAFMDPAGVEALVEAARPHRPDLVLLTGDICDHLPWLAPTLAAVQTLRPRLGLFAALGNHEHYRGRGASIRGYEGSDIDLLLDTSRVVKVGESSLVLSGVDDPARSRGQGHYTRAIARALDGSPSDAFRLGLCHRPSGFRDLAHAGVDLTLSGHTHAGQIGVGERSVFEAVAPEAHLWGMYRQGDAQLYTSSGGGHWFAFRLNCPSEAALITLERA
jgi:predicted MPP superfamily phosphohydrolase